MSRRSAREGGRTPTTFLITILLHSLFVFAALQWLAHNVMPFHYFFGVPSASTGDSGEKKASAAPPRESGRWLHAWHIEAEPSVANRFNYEQLVHLILFHVVLGAVTYVTVTYVIVPPFGRYAAQTAVSITIPNTLSWMLQEAPTVWNLLYFVLYEYPSAHRQYATLHDVGGRSGASSYSQRVAESLTLLRLPLLLFILHYIHRSFIFPLFLGRSRNDIPLHVNLCATVYCLFNGRLQLLANLTFYPPLSAGGTTLPTKGGAGIAEVWLGSNGTNSPSFPSLLLVALLALGGAYGFFRGMYINMRSDYALIDLRRDQQQQQQKKQEETPVAGAAGGKKREAAAEPEHHHYAIPYGFYFAYVSCPNFYGELVEWLGYSLTVLATGFVRSADTHLFGLSVVRGGAAFSFFVYTAANLVPRARAHHAWYLRTFGDAYRALGRHPILPWGGGGGGGGGVRQQKEKQK